MKLVFNFVEHLLNLTAGFKLMTCVDNRNMLLKFVLFKKDLGKQSFINEFEASVLFFELTLAEVPGLFRLR